jgi:hypothetical protein
MNTYGGSGDRAPPFLLSALDRGEWCASRPCRFTPREIARNNHWIRGWVRPTVGLDTMMREISLALTGNQTRALQIVACRFSSESLVFVSYLKT